MVHRRASARHAVCEPVVASDEGLDPGALLSILSVTRQQQGADLRRRRDLALLDARQRDVTTIRERVI
jgi:hypothetical protein